MNLLIIGGGINGLALAVHAARGGMGTTLLEAGALGGVSTQRSGALVRTNYEDGPTSRLALRALEHFEAFDDIYGGPSGFTSTGFAYVPEPDELESGALERQIAMLQQVGVDAELVASNELARIDPSIDVSDVGAVLYEPRSGFAEPALTTFTLARAAGQAGAELHQGTMAAELVVADSGAVEGARLPSGMVLRADVTVLCCGAWARRLALGAGLDVPIRPTAMKLAFFRSQTRSRLAVIDAPGGIYFRPDVVGTLVGWRTRAEDRLADPDAPLPEIDDRLVAKTRERLAARVPAAAGAVSVGSRAGLLDMTPDALPFVGPSAVPGLWLCCGWSARGFKSAPAVGEALAHWLATGERDDALHPYRADREMIERGDALRSPH